MVVRWQFDDPVSLETYTFAINPSEGGSPGYNKRFDFIATAAPDGRTLVFEGRDEPQELTFSGTLLTEAEFNAFVEWYQKRYQVLITDDLGRQFHIIVKSFVPVRERARSHPWKHSYTVAATVVDWQ